MRDHARAKSDDHEARACAVNPFEYPEGGPVRLARPPAAYVQRPARDDGQGGPSGLDRTAPETRDAVRRPFSFDPGARPPSPAGDGSALDPEPGQRCPPPPLAPLSKSPRSVARLAAYAARDAESYTRGQAVSPTRPLSECDAQWNELLNGHRFESVTVKQKHFIDIAPMRDEAREISR